MTMMMKLTGKMLIIRCCWCWWRWWQRQRCCDEMDLKAAVVNAIMSLLVASFNSHNI